MLLRTHVVEILRCIKAAAHGTTSHTHAHEAGHSSGGVAGCGLHSVGSCRRHTAGHHKGIGAHGHGIFHILDLLHILRIQGDGIQRDLSDGNAAADPICLQGLVHSLLQFICLGRNLGRTQLLLCQCAECRLQSGNEVCLHLLIDLIPGVSLLHIAADLSVEQQRIRNIVGIHTVAADIDRTAHAHALIDHFKDDGAGCTELVAHDLLGIEIVNSLILAGVTAVGEALTNCLESLLQTVTEFTCKDGRFCGSIIGILTGLGTNFHHLALLHDDHALAVGNGNAGAIGDNIVTAAGIGTAAGGPLLTLDNQSVHIQGITVEKLLPLICQHATQGADSCFDKTHNDSPFAELYL